MVEGVERLRARLIVDTVHLDEIIREVLSKHDLSPLEKMMYHNFGRQLVRHPYAGIRLYRWYAGEMTKEEFIAFFVKTGWKAEILKEIAENIEKEFVIEL